MPRKKKHPIEMTTDETIKKLFPKEVRKLVKDAVQKSRKSEEKSSHK
jgi:hypothetical protein